MEVQVLKALAWMKGDELIEALDKLNPKLWSKEFQPMLELMSEYAQQEKPGGDLTEYLIYNYKPISLVTDLFIDAVPNFVGRQYLETITKDQEDVFLRKKLKDLANKPASQIRDEIQEILKTPSSVYKPKSLGETARARVEEKKLERVAPSTGYFELDRFIKGFIPGHVYVLSGDTNAGKSTMCLNFVHRISQQNKTSLYFSLEPENTMVDYLASIRHRKRFSDLTDEDITYDDPNIDVFGKEQIREIDDLVRAVRTLPRYDFIVVDHIGYFTSNTSNTVAKQSDVMKDLAGLAKERQCAIMLVQHLNKGKADKKSPENNITGSAAFKQDATDVLILKRDTEEDAFGATKSLETGAILVRKSKSDMPQGAVPIKFVDKTALILDGTDQAKMF